MWSWYLASRAVCLLLLVPESGVLSDITYFARVLAESRGLAWVEIDLAELRGEREPALTLFA